MIYLSNILSELSSPSLFLTRLIALKFRFDSLLLVSAIMSASLRATVPRSKGPDVAEWHTSIILMCH
jgi:hypothetical protein